MKVFTIFILLKLMIQIIAQLIQFKKDIRVLIPQRVHAIGVTLIVLINIIIFTH